MISSSVCVVTRNTVSDAKKRFVIFSAITFDGITSVNVMNNAFITDSTYHVTRDFYYK